MPKFAMPTFKILAAFAVALCFCGGPALARHHHHHHYDNDNAAVASGLAGDTLLIVRHAEKPDGEGNPGLAPAGEARAKAYADYFAHLQIDGAPVKIGTIIASSDSENSARPRLTVTPFSQASGIKIEQPFPDKEVKALAHWLAAGSPNRTILIAWHHESCRNCCANSAQTAKSLFRAACGRRILTIGSSFSNTIATAIFRKPRKSSSPRSRIE